MAGTPKFTVAQIKTAIKGSAGIKVVICERLKCNRQTLENYIDRDPSIAEDIKNEREQVLDFAELIIISNIKYAREIQQATQERVDTSDAWKLLDKLGLKRGYGEKVFVGEGEDLSGNALNEDEIVRRVAAILTIKAKKKNP